MKNTSQEISEGRFYLTAREEQLIGCLHAFRTLFHKEKDKHEVYELSTKCTNYMEWINKQRYYLYTDYGFSPRDADSERMMDEIDEFYKHITDLLIKANEKDKS